MPLITDQTGRSFELPHIPHHIISLVPSITELLADLDLDQEVVGITKFCIHPDEWFRSKTRVGGTKQVKYDVIQQLAPDLIIANKEENVKEQIEELARHYPVYVSDVNTLPDAYQMIEDIGRITDRISNAKALTDSIHKNFSELKHIIPLSIGVKPKTAYLIWRDPYMTVGGDTFIHSMMTLAGLDNLYANRTRYPQVTLEELKAANCELLILSSEPFPFNQHHVDEIRQVLPRTRIILADGEMFSWYGSRLVFAPLF